MFYVGVGVQILVSNKIQGHIIVMLIKKPCCKIAMNTKANIVKNILDINDRTLTEKSLK